jgi:excisionase family DNA binding protein
MSAPHQNTRQSREFCFQALARRVRRVQHGGVGEELTSGMGTGRYSGTNRTSDRGDYYTVSEAAKVLSVTDRRVRALAQEGRIEGERMEGGWKLFRYSVHSFRDERRERGRPSAAYGADSLSVSDWVDRVEALQRQLGRLESRLELTEKAESTVREERDRLLQDLERERAERLEAQQRVERLSKDHVQLEEERSQVQDEVERLREELEAERNKGFWRRLFGG